MTAGVAVERCAACEGLSTVWSLTDVRTIPGMGTPVSREGGGLYVCAYRVRQANIMFPWEINIRH